MLTKEFINKLKYYHTKKEYKSLIKDSKEMLKKHPNSFFYVIFWPLHMEF